MDDGSKFEYFRRLGNLSCTNSYLFSHCVATVSVRFTDIP